MKCLGVLIACLLLAAPLAAGTASLSQSATSSGTYTTAGFSVCSSGTRSFRVSYNYGSNPGGVGANPYRMTVRFYKDGNLIGSSPASQASSAWLSYPFYNVGVTPGTYMATVQFERRTLLNGWITVETATTNSVVASTTATPNFNVNGIAVPADGSPINVCASIILINAAATSCETSYWVGIHERDRWWNRSYQYEWGTWFAGQAPNNISLQKLAANSAAYWINGPASWKGGVLVGGYMDPPNNSVERHYMVEVCTAEPSWKCKQGLIRVNGSC